jgi:hypothetical protein
MTEDAEGVSGLFQTLFGQAAKLLQPRLDKRKQALSLVNMDALGETSRSLWTAVRWSKSICQYT